MHMCISVHLRVRASCLIVTPLTPSVRWYKTKATWKAVQLSWFVSVAQPGTHMGHVCMPDFVFDQFLRSGALWALHS